MALENLVLFIGGTLGYGNPRTLSDVSVKNCAGDMRELGVASASFHEELGREIAEALEGASEQKG